MDDSIRQIEELAHRQAERFTRAQVAKFDRRGRVLVQSQLRSHKWRRETSRVLSLPGAPQHRFASMWTAKLHLGDAAVLSHFSAARLHRLHVDNVEPDSLTLPNGSNRRMEGFELHQRNDHSDADVTFADGLLCTSIERTLFDLGGTAGAVRIEAWLDQLTADNRVDPYRVVEVVERLQRRGKHSVPALIKALDIRLGDTGATQGRLERALADVVRLAGLPTGHAQGRHPAPFRAHQYVDRAWPDARLMVEADGRRWHDRLAAAARDARRDREAAAEGWMTVRFRYDDLVGNPETAAVELTGIHRHRLRDRSANRPGVQSH